MMEGIAQAKVCEQEWTWWAENMEESNFPEAGGCVQKEKNPG